MIVERTQPSVLVIEGVILKPALNVLNEEDSKKLSKSKTFAEYLKIRVDEKPIIRVIESGNEDSDLPLKASDKIELVKKALNYETLDALEEGEERQSVLKAIEKQRKVLTDHRDEDDE